MSRSWGTGAAHSLVLRAWTEGGELRTQISAVQMDEPAPEPVMVTSIPDVLAVVRDWIIVQVLAVEHHAENGDDATW